MADTEAQSVFIGGIATEATADQLSAHLTSLGVNASSVNLMQNAAGISKGCAIVGFDSVDATKAAIVSIDNTELLGKVMNAREDRGSRGRRRGQPANEDPTLIYIGNLNVESTQDDITSFFASFGTINAVKLHRKRRSEEPQGWATVQFGSVDEARAALTANGSELGGSLIVVEELKSGPRPKREYKPREEDEKAEAPPVGSLHVGNLAWSVNEDDLTKLFADYGVVESVEIARNVHTDKSRGWGSVKMATAEQATAALEAVHGTALHERELDVQVKSKVSGGRTRRKGRAAEAEDGEGGGRRRRKRQPRNNDGEEAVEQKERKPRERKPKKKKEPEPIAVPNPECYLYVGNLAWDATEGDLQSLFAQAGSVASASITTTKRANEERSRGWGTVVMVDGAAAEAAVQKLNGVAFMERELLVRPDTRVVKA